MPTVIPNGIGNFAIGISPIGVQPILDWLDTVLSQYANSPTITSLIASEDAALDQSRNIDLFYDNVFNVLTAQGYGLDVWGRIVGVGRTLEVSTKYFGFDEATTASADPFYQSPFYMAGDQSTSNVVLADGAYRTLILAKMAANLCDGSVAAINQLLLGLFPDRGSVYVVDNLDGTMVYTFEFNPTPVELSIVENSGVLPRPPGVSVSFNII